MHTHRAGAHCAVLIAVALLGISFVCSAADGQADNMKEMQGSLNAQTLSKPFETPDPEEIETDLDEAVKSDTKPPMQPGPNWRSGYTCASLLPFSFYEYRDCMLYYRYYSCYYCL